MPNQPRRRLVILGSMGVGKSTLVSQYIFQKYAPDYDPTIEDLFTKKICEGNQDYSLDLLDTSGEEAYWQESWIESGDAYMLVYNIGSTRSFDTIKDLCQSIQKHGVNSPIMIVGNKTDGEVKVTKKEGANLARELGCGFVETSAIRNKNVEEAFDAICGALYLNRPLLPGGLSPLPPSAPSPPPLPSNRRRDCNLPWLLRSFIEALYYRS